MTYFKAFPPIKSDDPLITGFIPDHVKNWNYYISTTTMFMATKFGKMVTFHDGFSPIKAHDFVITWYCKITW